MAIGWPETTDDASLATGAKRRMAQERVSCFARNDGHPGVPMQQAAWGGCRQGKKVGTCRCGIGGRGEAVLRSDQPIEEAVWSGRWTDADGDDGDLTRPAWETVRSLTGSSLPIGRPGKCFSTITLFHVRNAHHHAMFGCAGTWVPLVQVYPRDCSPWASCPTRCHRRFATTSTTRPACGSAIGVTRP